MTFKKNFIWFFGTGKVEGGKELNYLLGNKGAQLCEMSKIGIPIPPGFIITTKACIEYMRHGKEFLKKIENDIFSAVEKLKKSLSNTRGKDFPLLVSVRSGAPVSMPGMLDTILNVGMNKNSLSYLEKINPRFAYDTWRRFIQMFSSVVFGISRDIFEKEFEKWKKAYELTIDGKFSSVEHAYHNIGDVSEKSKLKDTELPDYVLKLVAERYLEILDEKGITIPEDLYEQILLATEAVFRSWNNERAVIYRTIHNIPHDLGTAVNIVSMVFGNMGEDSGTGVLFTRNANTGEKEIWGNFLPNAQGEDVVAGIRTPHALNESSKSKANEHLPTLEELIPRAYKELKKISEKLEHHYKDMQDVEFTIERGKVWILQTRTGKRSAIAHIKIVHDFMKEKIISKKEAITRISPKHLDEILFPVIDESKASDFTIIARGIPASPGAVSGKVVFHPKEAEILAKEYKEDVILVRHETSPEDIAGIASAKGILTSRGGETSHAAVVARAMGKPAVVGAENIIIDYDNRLFKVGELEIKEKEVITIDGNTGKVFLGTVPVKKAELTYEAKELFKVADEVRKIGVRANADTPEEAEVARKLGAEGIGLLRTEHMFFEEEKIPIIRKMIILADKYKRKFEDIKTNLKRISDNIPEIKDEIKIVLSAINSTRIIPSFERGRNHKIIFTELEKLVQKNHDPQFNQAYKEFKEISEEYFSTLKTVKGWMKDDLKKILKVMEGLPVTIRLIDPPLHEFLPKTEEEIRFTAEKTGMRINEIKEAIERLKEVNPMLGNRGIRVGITYPEIYCMQIEAIFESSAELLKSGVRVKPEIMFPNIIDPQEVKYFRNVVDSIVDDIRKAENISISVPVGTMIEFPRACVLAGEIAKFVDFFSFGTNDLTQTTLGISRDDAGKFLPDYVGLILSFNPFSQIDTAGVGELIQIAIEKGKKANPKLKLGVCGEHGGDPESIKFFSSVGLDYVSASPFRIITARLASAQSAISEEKKAIHQRLLIKPKKPLRKTQAPRSKVRAKNSGSKKRKNKVSKQKK